MLNLSKFCYFTPFGASRRRRWRYTVVLLPRVVLSSLPLAHFTRPRAFRRPSPHSCCHCWCRRSQPGCGQPAAMAKKAKKGKGRLDRYYHLAKSQGEALHAALQQCMQSACDMHALTHVRPLSLQATAPVPPSSSSSSTASMTSSPGPGLAWTCARRQVRRRRLPPLPVGQALLPAPYAPPACQSHQHRGCIAGQRLPSACSAAAACPPTFPPFSRLQVAGAKWRSRRCLWAAS